MPRAVKRPELLLLSRLRSDPGHLLDLKHLEVERPGAIHHHLVLVETLRDLNTVRPPRHEIDRRRAEKIEASGVDLAVEPGVLLVEQQDDVEGAGLASRHQLPQPVQTEKK